MTNERDSVCICSTSTFYWVSDEQLRAYMALSLIGRLKWVDDARRFTLAAQTSETRARMERLRRGETIT